MAEKLDIKHWNETTLNHHIREAMLQQGLRALHIREANFVGVFDLIVSEYLVRPKHTEQRVLGWFELKDGWDAGSMRPAQRDFGREQWADARNCWVGAMIKENETLLLFPGIVKFGEDPLFTVSANPYKVDWLVTFERLRELAWTDAPAASKQKQTSLVT